MGGRGATYSYNGDRGRGDAMPVSPYAIGSLNKGTNKGTNIEQAKNRFRSQMLNQKIEYSAYYDSDGYIHSLGSSGQKGTTAVESFSTVAKEKRITGVIHNHPYQEWAGGGATFSKADIKYLKSSYDQTNGRIREIVATAKEGIYTARISRKKVPTDRQISRALSNADKKSTGSYSSKKKMRETIHNDLANELGKIGIEVTFTSNSANSDKLITQKLKK